MAQSCRFGSSSRIALEVLADLDVGVFLNTLLIFSDELEIRPKYPTVGQISVRKVVVLVRIAAQVVDHGQLWLDVATLDGGRNCIIRVAEDRLIDLPLNRHQLAVDAEEHVAVAAGPIALAQHEGRGVDAVDRSILGTNFDAPA